MEAIEQVTEVERQMRERRAAADEQARKIKADAEQAGQARVAQARVDAAEQGKALLKQAEERAGEKAAEIQRKAEEDAAALRQAAEQHLTEAVDFIVGRVVSH